MNRENLCFVIACAGLGSRMQQEIPKSLISAGRSPILKHILDQIESEYANPKIILVINEKSRKEFERFLQHYPVKANINFAFQNEPNGTAQALLSGLNLAKTKYSILIWGDQLGASKFPFNEIAEVDGDFLVPIVKVQNPYVYFDPITENFVFYETKTGSPLINEGYQDCGVFYMKTNSIHACLQKLHEERKLSENLLHELKSFQANGLSINFLQMKNIDLRLGANTLLELEENVKILDLG